MRTSLVLLASVLACVSACGAGAGAGGDADAAATGGDGGDAAIPPGQPTSEELDRCGSFELPIEDGTSSFVPVNLADLRADEALSCGGQGPDAAFVLAPREKLRVTLHVEAPSNPQAVHIEANAGTCDPAGLSLGCGAGERLSFDIADRFTVRVKADGPGPYHPVLVFLEAAAPMITLKGDGRITAIEYGTDAAGELLAVASKNVTVFGKNGDAWSPVRVEPEAALTLAMSPDAAWIATTGYGSITGRLFPARSNAPTQYFNGAPPGGSFLEGSAWSPTVSRFGLLSNTAGTLDVRLFDVGSLGAPALLVPLGATSCACYPEWFAVGTAAILFVSGSTVREVPFSGAATSRTLPFPAFARAGGAGATTAWLAHDGNEPVLLDAGGAVVKKLTDAKSALVSYVVAAFSPDGTRVALGNGDGLGFVFDAATGARTWKRRIAQVEISAVAWSPDGRELAFGDSDGTVSIWPAP